MKKKKVALRKCVACNERKPKQDLLRVVKNKTGHVDVDLTGRMNGRGSYICPTHICLDKVEQGNQLSKALNVNIPDKLYDQIRDVIEHD